MATLNHLVVSGIRSFGPDRDDTQSISFDKPLTLILGRNGCGKTTIIESLKYACTGSMPAGQGSSFVRDPKLDRRVETKAQIKLQFTSCQGKASGVSRSLNCVQKMKKLSFSTLDTSVSVTDKNGQTNQTSGRHFDIDDLMIKLLGVSKPILNYVIFCHQEESFWPLDEGKKLKDKFDEIFDSTKYKKCMDAMCNLRKEFLQDLRVNKEALSYMQNDVKIVKRKRIELNNAMKQFNDTKEKVQNFENDVSDCEKERVKWQKRYTDYRKIEGERDVVKNELLRYVSEKDTLKRLISHVFTGTKEELQVAIQDFDAQLHVKEQAVKKINKEKEEVNALETKTQGDISNIQNRIGKLEADKDHEQRTAKERNLKLSKLAEEFGLPPLSNGATEVEVDNLTGKVRKEIISFSVQINSLIHKQEKEQGEMQENIIKCLETKTKLEAELSIKDADIRKISEEIQSLNEKLREVNINAARKQRVDDDLQKYQHEHKEAVKSEDFTALSTEIKNLRKACVDLENQQSQLFMETKKLHKHQEALKELQKSEQRYNEHQNDIKKLRSQNYDFISKHLSKCSDGNIKSDLEELIQKLKKELDRLNKQLAEKKHEVASFDQAKKYKKDLLLKKQDELHKTSESIRTELHGARSLDDLLESLATEIDTLQNETGLVDSSKYFYSRFIKTLKERNPCCPVCDRAFDSEQEVEGVIDSLCKKLTDFPAHTEASNRTLSELKERERKLLQLKPVQKANEKLKNEDVPQLEMEISRLDESLDTAHEEIALLEGSLRDPGQTLRIAESIQNDIFEIDRCNKESKLLARQIEKLKRDNPVSTSCRSYDEAVAEQQFVQEELSAKRREKDEQEDRHNAYLKKVNDLEKKINNLGAEQLKIKQLVQEEESLKERFTEVTGLKASLNTELEQLRKKLIPILEHKKKAEEALDLIKEKHKKIVREKEREKENKNKQIDAVSFLEKKLNEYKTQSIRQTIEDLNLQLDQCQQKIRDLKEKNTSLAKKSQDLNDSVAGHQRRRKELEENLNLMDMMDKIEKQEHKLKQVEEKLGIFDILGVSEKCKELDKELLTLNQQMNEHKGKLAGYKENIQCKEKELNEGHLKNAEQKFQEKFVEVEVSKSVEKDLQKYYNALDFSMQKFHRDRMAHINKYIRDLWRIIYKGNDIDYIEIKTDESTSSATNDTDRRKIYNYRVVQVKCGTEIDMRGRCSAGQKVLACLIIRMALAETFSTNCGILALDEPTTNLDKDNIESLCQAISDIVSDREGRRTFQLLLITHDHEFLRTMSHHDYLTHYYEISRTQQSKSQIRRKPVH